MAALSDDIAYNNHDVDDGLEAGLFRLDELADVPLIEAALRQAEPGAKSEAITLEIASRIATLSPRERQVMDGLIAGLSNKLIAREYDISPRTIEVYRANVMTKMQAAGLSELVRLAMRAGALKD